MPKLKTNKHRTVTIPIPEPPGESFVYCTKTYEDYLAQRVTVPDFTKEKVDELTENFKSDIAVPVHTLNPNIEMGEYFVIPVAELLEMIMVSGDSPEFIHVCCALRSVTNSSGEIKKFPVTILVPVKKISDREGKSVYEICRNPNTVYVEAYPCPPDPRCPKPSGLIDDFFNKNTRFNDFKALL